MALTKTLWTPIINLVTTGSTIRTMFNTAFSNVDTAIDKIDELEVAKDGLLSYVDTFSVLDGQSSPSYNLSTAYQPIANYATTHIGSDIASNITIGSITPSNSGWYQVIYTGDISFTSVSSTRSITLSLNDGISSIASSVTNIPRDASRDSESLVMVMYLVGGNAYHIEVLASVAMTVSFNALNYSIKLVG